MQQQINLYNFLREKKGFGLTKKTVLLSYVAFILLLLALHSMLSWQKHKLNIQLEKLTTEAALQQQQLTMLMQKYPVTDPEALKKNILQLKEEYQNKVRSVDLLLPDSNFSKYLIGLGNAIVSGVWLSQITFNRDAPQITLKGFTLQPVLLEGLFTQLASQPIFSNMTFRLNEIRQTTFPASFIITAKKVNKS